MIKHAPKVLFALALAGCSSIIPAKAGPITLVKNNQPNATIVLQADAPDPMKAAAGDLQKYIQKISGVQLPLKTDGKDVSGITLNIGKTATTQAGDFPDAKLNPETYAVTQRGDDVYFEGNYPSPTAFAVYSFLQNQLGVRWFAPGDDWDYVPQNANKSTFTVNVKNEVSVPGTSPRIWSGHSWNADWKNWELRNKAVVSEKVLRRNFQNNMYRIFPPSKYAKTHPEYYPLINGKRWIPEDDNQAYWWPCIGNKDVQRITEEYIHQWFKDHPDQDSFSLGMDDIAYMCDDPLCQAMDSSPDDYIKRQFSSRYYKFINIIAKEVKKTDPDKYIGVLIYSIVVNPPVDVPKIEDNVFGYIANGSAAQWYQDGKKKQWMDNTYEWAKRVKKLSRYDYFGMGTFAPRVFPHNMAEMMDVDHSLGFEGSYVEMYTFLPQTAPMIWAFAQKQWNPSLKIDDLLNEFYTKMYGPAAPTMKKYFDLMEKSWNTERPGHTGWVHRNLIHQVTSISSQAVNEGMNLLNQAYNQAANPMEKRRIDVTRGGLQFASYPILQYALAQQIAATAVDNTQDAKQLADNAAELGKLISEQQKNWPLIMQRQDLLGDNLRDLDNMKLRNGEGYLQTETSALVNPALPGILRLISWYNENQPAQAAAISQQLITSFPAGGVKDAITSWNWVQQNHPKSLLTNGNFENNAQNTTTAAQEDWSSKGAPVSWNTWSSQGKVKFLKAQGRSGNAFRVQSNLNGGDNGVIIQNATLNPTSKYLGVAWVKSADATLAPNATITFRFRTDKGWFTGTGASVSSGAAPSSQWQQIIISSDVPKGATGLAFMLGTNDGDAIFDDAALYEIPAK
jgi:hypothetical protein